MNQRAVIMIIHKFEMWIPSYLLEYVKESVKYKKNLGYQYIIKSLQDVKRINLSLYSRSINFHVNIIVSLYTNTNQ